jgi:hypothetical protein
MLKDYLKQGVRIEGLFELISTGRDASEGSWNFESHLTSRNVIRFFDDDSGKHPVRILPYKRGTNAATPMAGCEVISGEFTGCIMGVYKNQGIAMVNHVDTEVNGDGEMPQKGAWEKFKQRNDVELFNESSTKGLIPKFITGLSEKKLREYGTGIVILCVASPTKYYSITRAAVYRDSSHCYQVLKIL